MENLDFISFDNKIIKCYLFIPQSQPRGIVQIVHGLEEHGMRYENFAKFLNSHGLIVLASDQRLHGKTAGENLSKTKIKDVFPVMVKDQMLISDMLLERFNLPLIIFGHSYGSFIVQNYIQNYHKHSGVILSGSAYMKRLDTFLGKLVSWLYVNVKNGEDDAKQLENLVIGSFNRSFKGNGSWISANAENVKKYELDPLCGNPLCGNFYYSMFKNTRLLYDDEAMSKIDKNTPILIASGEDDPVGKMGKSAKKLYDTYTKFNIDCTFKLYPNLRHEIINEGQEVVMQDMLEFIDEILK